MVSHLSFMIFLNHNQMFAANLKLSPCTESNRAAGNRSKSLLDTSIKAFAGILKRLQNT